MGIAKLDSMAKRLDIHALKALLPVIVLGALKADCKPKAGPNIDTDDHTPSLGTFVFLGQGRNRQPACSCLKSLK